MHQNGFNVHGCSCPHARKSLAKPAAVGGPPSHGPYGHSDAASYTLYGELLIKYAKRHLHDSTAQGSPCQHCHFDRK
jgi:hypothetical protein